ncbi:RNA polymerase sigma factor [Streptomyces sp. NPDC006463]|uniref:RNA polymerase sigma factor n=1 Tax=Streptomyces sp. NPDC006463 TaxID=3364746 RepID=UPI0036B5BFF3
MLTHPPSEPGDAHEEEAEEPEGPGEAGEETFDLRKLTRAQHAELRVKVIASLRRFDLLSPAVREDIADGAIEQVFRSGRLDPKGKPVAYIKKTAARLAMKLCRTVPVEELAPDCASLEMAVHHAAARDGRYQEQEFGPTTEGVDDAAFWGPTDDEETLALVRDAIAAIPARQAREVTRLRGEGMPAREVGETLGIPSNQVDQQWHRGRKAVRASPDVEDRIRPSLLTPPGQRRPKKGG